MILKNVLLVGVGGFLGSILRYCATQIISILTNSHWYPFGTLTVNFAGSLIVGFVAGVLALKDGGEHVQLFLIIGFLGGFTTFSTFSHESMDMLRNGQMFGMLAHILAHILLCLGGAGIGFALAK